MTPQFPAWAPGGAWKSWSGRWKVPEGADRGRECTFIWDWLRVQWVWKNQLGVSAHLESQWTNRDSGCGSREQADGRGNLAVDRCSRRAPSTCRHVGGSASHLGGGWKRNP